MVRFGMRALPATWFAVALVGAVASVPISIGHEGWYDTAFYPLNALGLALAGALISSRHRSNPLGWLMLAVGVVAAYVEFFEGYGYHASWPAAATSAWLSAWLTWPDIGSIAIIILLFPTGRDLGAVRRSLVCLGIAAAAAMTVGGAIGPTARAVSGVGAAMFVAVLVASCAVLAARVWRSTGVECQQLKWVAYVVSLLAVVGPLAIFFYNDSVLVQIAIAVVVTALPAAICVAILRYRLYDIDLIIHQTVVYGLLTALLAAAYAAVALVLGALAGGHGSAWVTAAATLAAAAAFRPLRARIQEWVDRRFRSAWHRAMSRVDGYLEALRTGQASPEELPELLRAVTGRTDVELTYVLPDEPVPDLVSGEGRTRRVVERAGVPLGVLSYADDSAADRLLVDLVERVGLAVEIGRLRAELRRQLDEVEASRARIVAAGYEERRRLERDLHDGAQQRLVSVGLTLRHAQMGLAGTSAGQGIDAAVDQLTLAINELRELANGVRPAHLDDGLDAALRELASRTPIMVDLHVGPERHPADIEATAYFVACEALTNAYKHAAATNVDLRVQCADGRLELTVADDGVGGAHPDRGSGLRGLSDRIAAQGGRMTVDSQPGAGTRLVAELPCVS
jgi:signal transduction histidine kinase